MSDMTRRQFVVGMAGAGLLTAAPWIWTSRKSTVHAQAVSRAFIGAEGFGATAGGWRSPNAEILFVKNLDDAGNNSFRSHYARADQGLPNPTAPRYIIFQTGGYIPCTSSTTQDSVPRVNNVLGNLNSGNVYVAGQTAPGGGITFRGTSPTNSNTDGIFVRASHTCLRFVRARAHADAGSNSWALGFWRNSGQSVAIVDHCSFSFATDDSVACNMHMSTIQYCLISEGLSRGDGNHARGALFDSHNGDPLYSLHHSAFLHAGIQRFPAFSSGQGGEMVNNLVYNWGGDGFGAGCYMHNVFNVSPTPKWDCVNHLMKWGPTSDDNGGGGANPLTASEVITGFNPCSVYISQVRGLLPGGQYMLNRTRGEPSPQCTFVGAKQWSPIWPVTQQDISTLELGNAWAASLLANVGCTRPGRDGIDTAVIASYDAYTGDSTTAHENQSLWALQNGGTAWPTLAAGTPEHLEPSGMTDEFITRMGLANTTASALSTSISQARGLGEDFQNIEWNLMEKAGDIAPLEGSSAGKVGKSGRLRTSGKVRL